MPQRRSSILCGEATSMIPVQLTSETIDGKWKINSVSTTKCLKMFIFKDHRLGGLG